MFSSQAILIIFVEYLKVSVVGLNIIPVDFGCKLSSTTHSSNCSESPNRYVSTVEFQNRLITVITQLMFVTKRRFCNRVGGKGNLIDNPVGRGYK